HTASQDAITIFEKISFAKDIPGWNATGTDAPEEMVLITQSLKEVQTIMSVYVGIVRSDLRLQRAFDRLEILWQENEKLYKKITISQQVCELRNIINTAYIIIKHARERKESRGLHFTVDYPEKAAEEGISTNHRN
ncbi:MAG TPA: L-aspartate oxidase, partial [Bacteroidia bacterium]|nr:L-aspartate oxidase [Bacteroidia bacterium]